jgi:RNA polymerase sigma factor (sigma-70 family)
MARKFWTDLETEEAIIAANRRAEAERLAAERLAAERQKRMSRRFSARLTKQTTGRWFCSACRCWHGKGLCPNKADRAIDYVERMLAHAFGQRESYKESVLVDLAIKINGWVRNYKWGAEVRERYLMHPDLGSYIGKPREAPVEYEGLLSPDRAKLVCNYLPLVDSLARQYAGFDALADDLEALGLERLVELARRYDAARGVTLGAFAKPHLRGAMRDRVRARISHEISVDPAKLDQLMADKSRKLPPKSKDDLPPSGSYSDKFFERGGRLDKLFSRATRAHRSFACDPDIANSDLPGAAHRRHEELADLTARFFAGGGAIRTSRRGPSLTDDLKRAIARLNPRQQVVYRGRVLTDPPVPRDELARQLGIADSTQISRILRQAERKVAKLVRPKVSLS